MWLIMPVMDETDYTALQEHYSLIILDIMLPGLDGWQVYARYALRISPLLFA